MANSSSSSDLRQMGSSSNALRSSSRSKIRKEKDRGQQPLRFIVSLQNMARIVSSSSSGVKSLQDVDTADGYRVIDPPVKEPFTLRMYNERLVRDALIDTHDLVNEPGGFVMNHFRHGQNLDPSEFSIHLGIKEKTSFQLNQLTGAIQPGTIRVTDDYAREIFKAIRCLPELQILTAILEINYEEDAFQQKLCPEMELEFLNNIIQTYPVTLTKLHVEMPGISAAYLPEWKFLLDQQMCLKILICNFGVVLWNFYLNCVSRNSRTLDRIVLRRLQTYEISSANYLPLDWKMFSECNNLSYLKLTCGCKRSRLCPNPPSSVFLHENFEALPLHNGFTELHLGNIWVDQDTLKCFRKERPNLEICENCNDMEYYEGDKDLDLVSMSRLELKAEYQSFAEVLNTRRNRDKQLTCLIVVLFHMIILALGILFIIIYFRHLRDSEHDHHNKSNIIANRTS